MTVEETVPVGMLYPIREAEGWIIDFLQPNWPFPGRYELLAELHRGARIMQELLNMIRTTEGSV